MSEQNLYERTIYLVRNAPRTILYSEMCAAAGKSRAWLFRFKKGNAPDSSITAVQQLHDFLASKQA